MEEVLTAVLILVGGFILLVKGADFFVDGAASVAKMLKIPSLIVGLTVVAMGTSLPECSVSIVSSMNGSNSLAISNAIGSNIFNLMVVCGVCTLFVPLKVDRTTLKRDFPISILCAAVLVALAYTGGTLDRIEGVVLLVLFVAFIIMLIKSAMAARNKGMAIDSEDDNKKVLPVWMCVVFIIGGGVAIKFGGDMVVDSAVTIARMANITETVIGLTIVALGTSLPELVTSVVAAKKDEVDMAVGNVIGSNVFNILLVLGVASTISPISFVNDNLYDTFILIAFSIIVWLLAWTKGRINRIEGVSMLTMFAGYMVYIFVR